MSFSELRGDQASESLPPDRCDHSILGSEETAWMTQSDSLPASSTCPSAAHTSRSVPNGFAEAHPGLAASTIACQSLGLEGLLLHGVGTPSRFLYYGLSGLSAGPCYVVLDPLALSRGQDLGGQASVGEAQPHPPT